MEKVSHSLLKRSFSSNPNTAFTSHKSVYDDVFGGPSKFGLPTLSPRLEDYSEIFGGFHASRSSSIPLLDLTLLDHDSDLHFDVRSHGFDYAMVFGDFGGSDFTASFEDLVGQSSRGGYDSSDEPWSPAHSGSLSDELDPIAGSDKSHEFSDDNVHETLQSIKQFNASYSKSSQRSMKTVLAATSHVTSFSAVPGYTFSHYESPVSWDGEDENCSLGVIDDINHNEESGERVREENQYESSSNPSHNSFAAQRNDCDPFEKHVNSTSPRGKPFVTVSDISLRTKPSRLPPPSRPPPRLVTKNGKCDESNSKLKASRSCAFERMADDTAQLFFDVEIDATTTISAKVTEDGNNNVKVKRQSAKEPIERKYIRSHSTMQVGEKTDKIVRVSSAIEDEKLPQSIGKETTVLEPVIEDRIESTESSEANSGPLEVQYCNHNAESSAGTVAWDETTGYFEVIEKNISSQAFDIVEDSDTLMQQMNQDVHNHQDKREHDIFKRVEDFQDFKVTKEAHRCVEESNQPQMNKEHYDCGNKQQQKIPNTRLSDQRGSPKTLTRINLACTYGINKIPENFQQLGECQKQEINHSKEVQPESEGNVNEVEAKLQLKGSPERMNVEKGFLDSQITEQNNGKHKQNILREEFQRRLEDVEGANTIREIAREREAKGTENRSSGVCGKQNENKLEETYELKESDLILDVSGHDKSWDGHLASENDMEAVRLIENEITLREAPNQISNDKEHKLNKRDVCKERNRDASRTGDNFLRSGVAETEAVNKEEDFEIKGYMSLRRDAGSLEQLSGHAEELEPIERIWLERGVERDLDSDVLIEGDQLKAFEGGYRVDEVIAANVLGKHDDVQMLEATQAAFSSEKNLELKTEPESSTSTYESETGIVDTPAKGRYDESSKNKDELQDKNTHSVRDDTVISPCLPKQVSDSSICSTGMGISCLMRDKISSALQYSHEPVKKMYSDDDGIQKMNSAHFASKRIDIMDNFNSDQVIRESVMTGRKAEDPSSFLKQNDDTLFSKKNASSQWTERKNIIKDNIAAKDQKVEGKIRREAALEDELMRKIEEEREREREREKDRMSVDKAALEARERSYSEARERAAVERATTEARKRAMAEARERLEKASMDARLRAERAAVERATAEARQRATEKLMAQKAAYAFHDQVERSIPDRFSASTRTVDTRQSYVSSDLHFQSTGISNGLRYSYSLVHEGAEGESPQRCKARLERCKRTAERAANALAEKNMRDLLAQREREERNRVAEALDVEVKRWSNGKEGNLRALLSTLQYILGPDSGWHPIPLTEVITSAAVKKAYRKATLCVHPDKLQQRGATIQQKYICEKVFDLLKEAWNKFNSEER